MTSNSNTPNTVLLAGATGLVGGSALRQLLHDGSVHAVHTLTRKPVPLTNARLKQHIVNFERIEEWSPASAIRSVVCCLGTTIRTAGSQNAFRRVDLDYVVALGRLARRIEAKNFILISAMGANSKSRIFYNRTKGEAEEELRKQNHPSLHILRPSLLLGERSESRVGERIGTVVMRMLNPALIGSFRPYRAILASDVARAVVVIANSSAPGTHIHDSSIIQRITDSGLL